MKYLIILILLLTSCTMGSYDEVGETYIKNKIHHYVRDVENMKGPCIKLGKCMGGTYRIVHFPNQDHAPYACDIRVDTKRDWYFYPDADLMFGDLDMNYFQHAQAVCELLKERRFFR